MRSTSPPSLSDDLVAAPADLRAAEEAGAVGMATMAATTSRDRPAPAPNSRAAASAASSRSIAASAHDPFERAMDGPADARARRRRLARAERRLRSTGARHGGSVAMTMSSRGAAAAATAAGRSKSSSACRCGESRARRADAAPPRRTGRRQVRLGRAEDEAPLRARHRDVEPVQLLALARPQLVVERGAQRVRAAVLVVDEGASRRPLGLDRPLDEQRRRRRVGALRLGVHHEHGVGLESLGAVHGEQAHASRRAPAAPPSRPAS